jgi:hypothetical protein
LVTTARIDVWSLRHPPASISSMRRRRRLLGGSPKLHHRVYCIELHPAVRRQARFRRQNPHARYDATCLYVGSTGLDPEARFENHLRGHKGCPLVRTYGVRLRPDLFADFPAMTWEDAVATEAAYAEELRELRYAVYQH